MKTRRDYGEGSLYQRSDGRWMASIEAGTHPSGTRRRVTVSSKGCPGGCPPRCPHRAEIKKRLRDKRRAIEAGGVPTQSSRTTVKQWSAVYLDIKKKKLSPRGYNAAASPVRRWIVPTIGHRRLDALTPADLRAVEQAQRDAKRKGSTAAATHRALLTMLRAAIVEGHHVPQRVLLVEGPATTKSDRLDIPIPEALACLLVASGLRHGTRWALSLLYGARQGEALGLLEECVDFTRHEIRLEWQLDNLPYDHGCAGDAAATCEKRPASCPRRRFRVPEEYVARHLVDSWHLIRPKTDAGVRVLPMTEAFERAVKSWLEVRPDNPWGLVWPTLGGRPANDKHDLAEWHAIQGTAAVVVDPADERRILELAPLAVGHPGGRHWHTHECRNMVATQMGQADVDAQVMMSLLGHTDAKTTGGYRTVHHGPKLAAVQTVAELLPLPDRFGS